MNLDSSVSTACSTRFSRTKVRNLQFRGKVLMSTASLQEMIALRDRLKQEVEAMEVQKEIAALEATKEQLLRERQGTTAGTLDEPPANGPGSNGSRATSPSSLGSKRQRGQEASAANQETRTSLRARVTGRSPRTRGPPRSASRTPMEVEEALRQEEDRQLQEGTAWSDSVNWEMLEVLKDSGRCPHSLHRGTGNG